MSNVRIRYSNMDDNGKATSRRVFTTSDQRQVKVELDFVGMKYLILDANDGSVVSGPAGDTVNRNVLKIQAKEEMLRLGVHFGAEDRAERAKPDEFEVI